MRLLIDGIGIQKCKRCGRDPASEQAAQSSPVAARRRSETIPTSPGKEIRLQQTDNTSGPAATQQQINERAPTGLQAFTLERVLGSARPNRTTAGMGRGHQGTSRDSPGFKRIEEGKRTLGRKRRSGGCRGWAAWVATEGGPLAESAAGTEPLARFSKFRRNRRVKAQHAGHLQALVRWPQDGAAGVQKSQSWQRRTQSWPCKLRHAKSTLP
ncbi:hypothetical protein BDZ91DRAFT_801081 [Kalaharituber pfeilii]|nr:hypothetical protein BDZ91DRAFT_801081 [Kalaharituber pfeilii]